MSSLQPVIEHMSPHARPLAANHKYTAKQQAYLLRDLITKFTGKSLSGCALLDAYGQTFHDTSWSTLMATLRQETDRPYYATDARSAMSHQSARLSKLADIPQYLAIRALLSMPYESYGGARTMEGAILTTLLMRRPSWVLLSSDHPPVVYDRQTGAPFHPKSFSSDPMTNDEYVVGKHAETGEPMRVAVGAVCYVPPEAEPVQQFSEAIAKHWHAGGNAVSVTYWQAGHEAPVTQIPSPAPDEDAAKRFDDAVEAVRCQAGDAPLIFTPEGYREVHHPAERWERSMTELRAMLPELEAADAEYQAVWKELYNVTGTEPAMRLVQAATRRYNEVLLRAVDAYWRDTREVNSRSAVHQCLAPRSDELAFNKISPLPAIYKLLNND